MKSIVIYNPISGHGHLDSWSAIFTKILLESGWEVLIITPNSEILMNILKRHNCPNLDKLKVCSDNNYEVQDLCKNIFQKLWRKVNSAGHRFLFSGNELLPKSSHQLYEKYIAGLYLPLHFFRYYVFPSFNSKLKVRNVSAPPLVCKLREIEYQIDYLQFKSSIIFHMYLDSLNFSKTQMTENYGDLKYKWAGICFSPELIDFASLNKLANFLGVVYLDEAFSSANARKFSMMQSVYFPDIAEVGLASFLPNIINIIKARAGERKIVFLGGIVGVRKNLALWLDLIDRADPKKWYFIQIGEIDFKNLEAYQFLKIYKKLISPPENLMLLPSYILDEGIFNSILATTDIVFAVYKDFRNSSNMITKASFFHKPILVSERYLMGRRVEAYGIGTTVPEDNVQKIILGLEKLSSENIPSANFDTYNNVFNQEIFGAKFLKFMDELNES